MRAPQGGLNTRTFKQLKESRDRIKVGPASHASRQSKAPSAISSKRRSVIVVGVASKTTKNQSGIKLIKNNTYKPKKNLDDVSVITAERLSRFNQARGTIAGTKIEEIATAAKVLGEN